MITKQLTPDMAKKVEELAAVRADTKALEAREKILKTEILDYCDNAAAALKFGAEIRCMIEQKSSVRIDTTALRAKFPEAATACEASTTFLQIKCV